MSSPSKAQSPSNVSSPAKVSSPSKVQSPAKTQSPARTQKAGGPPLLKKKNQDEPVEVVAEVKQSTIDLAGIVDKMGYQILGYLICEDDGSNICQYIKVKDRIGLTMYVEPDVEGMVPISGYHITKTRVVLDGKIPYSLKNGAIEVVSPYVYGVAWECDSEVCILTVDGENREPREKIFVLEEVENFDDNLGEPITYPVVKISEILAKPEMIHENIKQASLRLRNIELENCDHQLGRLKTGIQQLHDVIQKYDHYRYHMGSKLIETINTLNLLYDEYLKEGTFTTEEQQKFQIIEHNLKIRLDKLTELIQLCQAIIARQYRLNQLTKEFDDLSTFASYNFSDIDKVYPLDSDAGKITYS